MGVTVSKVIRRDVLRRDCMALVASHNYDERLKRLNMYSLEHRRLYFDLLWCYKLLFGLVRVNRDDFLPRDAL